MRTHNMPLLAIGAFGSLLASTPALAQDEAEIVVTADRQEQRLRDVPQSVTALTSSQMERENLSFFDDYVARVPGMSFIQSSPQYSQLILRGVSTGFAQPNASVATYLDESPYGFSSPSGAGAVMSPNLDAFDMQRVEVLRGPQGTLYGANALGGLLKYVTARPDPNDFAARLQLGGNSFDGGGEGYDVHGMINAPLGEQAALRLVGYTIDRAGFIDNSLTGAQDTNDFTNTGVRASFLLNATENLTLRLTALQQELETGDQPSMDISRTTFAPIDGDLSHARRISQPGANRNLLLNGTATLDLGEATLTSSTSYAETEADLLFDLSATYSSLLAFYLGTPYGAANIGDIANSKVTQELRLAFGSNGWTWQLGGFFTEEDLSVHTVLTPLDPVTSEFLTSFPITLSDSDESGTYQELAAFANAGYEITQQLDVSVGARFSHIETEYHQTAVGILLVPADFDAASTEDVVTYSASARWRPSSNTLVYARAARGYQPGGPNRVTPIPGASQSYDAATTMNYELGLRTTFLDNRLSFDVAAFNIDWEDIQLAAVVGGFYSYTNGGAASSAGVEWNADFTPFEGLRLNANGAYTDAKLEDDAPASLNAFAGDALPYVPNWSASASADYEWNLSTNLRASVGASIRYTGERWSDFTTRVLLPEQHSVDLRASLDAEHWSLQLYAKNISDERLINSILPTSFTDPSSPLEAFISPPRQIGLQLTTEF